MSLAAATRVDMILDAAVRRQWWVWGLPVVVLLVVQRAGLSNLELAAGGLVGLGAVAVVRKYPAYAVGAIGPWIVLQTSVLAWLYRMGVPYGVIRPLRSLEDIVILGLLIAAVQEFRRTQRRFDVIDKLVLAFVAMLALYLFFPGLAGADAPRDWDTRFLAFRSDVSFVLLFAVARHAPLGSDALGRVARAALTMGVVVAAIGLFEWFFSSQWNDFAVNTLQVNLFKIEVLETIPKRVHEVSYHDVVAGRDVVRPGSLLYEPVFCGLYLVIGFGIGVGLIARSARGARAYLGPAVIALTVLLTLTRSAQLAVAIAGILALRIAQRSGQNRAAEVGRARLAGLGLAALIVLAPVALATGAVERISGEDSASGESHRDSLFGGLERLVDAPLGAGLGSSAGIGQRFGVQTAYTSHNAYLQIGNEVGIVSLGLFIALVVAMLRQLVKGARQGGAVGALCLGVAAAGIGLSVAGMLQHVWLAPEISHTFWPLAGVALYAAARASAPAMARQ